MDVSRARAGLGCLIVAASVLLTGAPLRGDDRQIAVIVHLERTIDLTLDDLRAIYLKQKTLWNDGHPITPINRDAGTKIRETFSRLVIGRDSEALARYWNERYIEGVFPPPTLSSNEAVVRYVAANKNTVGYVPASAVEKTVRVVLQID